MRRMLGVGVSMMSTFAYGDTHVDALGLYQPSQFEVKQGAACTQCRVSPQARWYFRHETFLVPKQGEPVVTVEDSKRWLEDGETLNPTALPSLVWTGSRHLWTQMTLEGGTHRVTTADGQRFQFALVPKIASNRSYWNARTTDFFADQPLRIRGELVDQTVIARTVWPQAYKLDLAATMRPLQAEESLQSLVQDAKGGARRPHESRLLWEKSPGLAQQSAGKAVLGILLNGAQGDDDEAHGGHFALATGHVAADGGYASWLVNNYYSLATHSEKGIIAGVTPFDQYMGDLNSGQAFYRPSYMVVAVFSQPQVPSQVQALSNRVMQHFYRHDFVYDHALENCAGISMDNLRQLGWRVPLRGVESTLKASAAYWVVAATEHSLQKGRAMYDYLNTEMTRLFPAVAFDAIGNDLLHIARTGQTTTLDAGVMQGIASQLEAIYFVRIPQIPSSRADGQAPVYRFAQYLQQAPADRSQWQIIPVTPNPLPNHLQPDALTQGPRPALLPLPAFLLLVSVIGLVALLIYCAWRWLKRNAQIHPTGK